MFHVYDVIFLTCVTSMMIRGLLAARSAARTRYAQLRHASAAALGASWLPTSCTKWRRAGRQGALRRYRPVGLAGRWVGTEWRGRQCGRMPTCRPGDG